MLHTALAMHVSEWPLVLFTILAQMAVGSFVTLGVVQLFARRHADLKTVDKLSDPALYAIGPVMVVAIGVSFFHLGNPVNALQVVGGLAHSWLSWELSFGAAFAVAGAVFALCQWRKWFTPLLRQLVAGVTALLGIGLVFCMSMVYAGLRTVPAWHTWATPVSFFATAFLLGALAVGTAFVGEAAVRRRRAADAADAADERTTRLTRGTLRGIGIASIVLLAVEFVVIPISVATLATNGSAAAEQSMSALMATGGLWFVLRLVLVGLGAGVLGFFLYRTATKGGDRILAITASSAFGLVLVAETLGRVLFYDGLFHVGI
jgi:anaerobic dimethyl sulfoxide reductase subunit C (anchor subunit)